MFGFLNVYKPVGMTSHDVVAKLRKLTNIKQIGHTGTLDPFAEGVLPICIGKATRLIEYLKDDKEYLATAQFGVSTTTYDCEGEVSFSSNKKVCVEEVKSVLKDFEGEIFQLPPIYSAIKVKGKKLYEYARSGQNVEIQPRKVFIENIELKSFDENKQQAEILIKCSKGTYIRSIANDLGENLGCGAHLVKLIRTQAGKFRVEDSVALDGIDVVSSLISPIKMLDLPVLTIDEDAFSKVRNGMPLKFSDIKIDNNCKDLFKEFEFVESQYVILTYNDNTICAVGFTDKDVIRLKKVFL